MNKKSMLETFSKRVTALRQSLHLSRRKMAVFFRATEVTYRRYEQGFILPSFMSLVAAGEELGISLDWLVYGRGEMYYRDIAERVAKQVVHEAASPEVLNLMDHIKRVPLVRNELLSHFYKIKTEHEEVIAREMEKTAVGAMQS